MLCDSCSRPIVQTAEGHSYADGFRFHLACTVFSGGRILVPAEALKRGALNDPQRLERAAGRRP